MKLCNKGAAKPLFLVLFLCSEARASPLFLSMADRLIFTMAAFYPTQGQWWRSCAPAGTERRVKLVASCMGFWLWTADFRDARTNKLLTSKFFCTKPNSEEPVALFENADDRQRWMERQAA